MQLLFEHSAEGDTRLPRASAGRIARLRRGAGLPVPHMGWNTLEIAARGPAARAASATATTLYFVHSYAAPVSAAHARRGPTTARAWPPWCGSDNFRGVQFHPERSAAVGARMLRNFLSL